MQLSRQEFVSLIPLDKRSLEIGALHQPILHPSYYNNKILDVRSTEDLKTYYADKPDCVCENIVNVDYVWSGQPYDELIKDKFDMVISSHNIEHQPDLIGYLNNIESVLQDDGRLYLIIPDCRFCFDHFKHDTKLHQVLAAHLTKQKQPPIDVLIEDVILKTHNNCILHRNGDHGETQENNADLVKQEYNKLKALLEGPDPMPYIDAHVWKFHPQGFKSIITMLKTLGLISFDIELCTNTRDIEFYAILKKTKTHHKII